MKQLQLYWRVATSFSADLLKNEYSTSGFVHVVRKVFHKMAPDSNSELLLRTFGSTHFIEKNDENIVQMLCV